MMNVTTSEVQLEMNEAWAMQNPQLFQKSVFAFFREHPADQWAHTVVYRAPAYITFVARLKPSKVA